MMINEALSWSTYGFIFIVLLLVAPVAYITGYYWTLGRHRALLTAFHDRQKKSTEVTKHDTQKQ